MATKVLYTGKTHTTGGREGAARSSDGRLDIALSSPGSSGAGTNPEQLFAAGWSACFIGALGLAAGARKIQLPADTPSMPRSISPIPTGPISCAPGSMSAFPASSARSPSRWSKPRTRPALIPRPRMATSTW
jgi:hypothetical protein